MSIQNGRIAAALVDQEAEVGLLNVCIDSEEEATHYHVVVKATDMGLHFLLVDDDALSDWMLEAEEEYPPIDIHQFTICETFAPWTDVVRATMQNLLHEYSVKMAMASMAMDVQAE